MAVAMVTVMAGAVLCELRHVEAGERISAGSAEPLDHGRAVVRHEIAANGRAATGETAGLVVHVRQRQPVQRPERSARGALGIGGTGSSKCSLFVHPDRGVA